MTTRTLPKRTSLQLRDVIADVLALAHRQLAEHRIETRTDFPKTCHTCPAIASSSSRSFSI